MAKKVDITIVKRGGNFASMEAFRSALRLATGGDQSVATLYIVNSRKSLLFTRETIRLASPIQLNISRTWSDNAWNDWFNSVLYETTQNKLASAGFIVTETVIDIPLS